MSNESKEAELQSVPPGPVKKRRTSLNRGLAIQAVHERKQCGYHVNHEAIAQRFGLTGKALRTLYCRWLKGEIDTGLQQTKLEKDIDERGLHIRMKELVRRHTNLCLAQYEASLFDVEDRMALAGKTDPKKRGENPVDFIAMDKDVHYLMGELNRLIWLRDRVDQGYNSYLEEMHDKIHTAAPANPNVPIPAASQTKIIALNDRERALQALREGALDAETGEPAESAT